MRCSSAVMLTISERFSLRVEIHVRGKGDDECGEEEDMSHDNDRRWSDC